MRVRSALVVSALLLSHVALAQDARISFLAKQLGSAKDPRVRAQTAVILGGTNNAAAVPALCAALRDQESVVRSAAASALGELRLAEATTCLRNALGEEDQAVRNALSKAMTSGTQVNSGGLYVMVEPVADKVGSLEPGVLKVAEALIREHLTTMGASFAPVGEAKTAASALIKSRKLKGFAVRTNLLPNGSSGLKIEMLIMTYPDQALQGSWSVKAAGGKYESQLKAMVPRVVDDAAGDLEWKQ